TAIAAWLTSPAASRVSQPGQRSIGMLLRQPLVALVGGLVVIGLLVGAATAGLGRFIATGPVTALAPTVLAPSPGPPGPGPSAAAPSGPAASADEPTPPVPSDANLDQGPLVPVVGVGDVESVKEGASTAAVSVV